MPLTDVKIRTAKPEAKPYKLQDGQGLYLDVRPSGAKIWRYRYWVTSAKDGVFTIGAYPAVSLADARKDREWARAQVKLGINPTVAKEIERTDRVEEAANTFGVVAREWIDQNRKHWSPTYCRQVENFLGKDVLPKLGKLPIRSVKAAALLSIIREVEARGAQSIAVLIRQWSGQIFRYAISTARADANPAETLAGSIRRRAVRHNPPLPKDEIPALLKGLDDYGGFRPTVIAIRLMMLTFVRTVEMRKAEWQEFDIPGATWRVPLANLKMGKKMLPGEAHIVPLSRQAIDLLEELKTFTGGRPQLFPNVRRPNDCMTATTINRVLERLGYGGQFSGHGFRTTASTMLHELGWRDALIEKQLAHADRNKVRAAYNHAEYLEERRAMMQAWADWIDGLS